MTFTELLQGKCEKIGLSCSDQQAEQFFAFYQMMIEKNRYMNLTAITEENEVIDKHFIDSLTCVRVVDIHPDDRVIDIGTGAGFPGIPLKIMYPDTDFVLVDSLNKRVKFLQEVCESIKLKNIDIIHGRAETLGHQDMYREKFDLCVSRAVANLSTLSEYCIPFVKKNGNFVSYKSKKGSKEIEESKKAVRILGGKIDNIDEFRYDNSDRMLIKIAKVKSTPKGYPRREGIPSRNPLS